MLFFFGGVLRFAVFGRLWKSNHLTRLETRSKECYSVASVRVVGPCSVAVEASGHVMRNESE